ncbi:hypothetical protein CR513_37072, partial [Mucuna pruriens]
MENNDRTLKELATLDVMYQPWFIQYPKLEQAQSYELKSRLIHLLPKFHGLASRDPHKYLKEFHVVCSTMRPHGILNDYIRMKAFPFSLDGAAKDWLYLQPVLFNTWRDIKRMFLEKFFTTSRIVAIRKEIYGIRQHTGETLHEYWERFNKLCATCPHHQISEQFLIQYFYEGLIMMDKSMINVARGRALIDKTPAITRNLISNMANLVKQMATSNIKFQQNVTGTIQDLKTQMGQLATTMNQLQPTGSRHLPSQTIQAKAIPLPFLTRIVQARKFELDEELLQTFRKVEINIPLLEAIKQILKYAKFLKELCTHKWKKLKGDVEMGRNVSALIKSKQVSALIQLAMPKKCRDPNTFTVPCTIGDYTFVDAMLDLGALINVMPSSMYKSLNFGDLEPTGVIIQLANRSIVHPLGILEDVLVRINELIFPAEAAILCKPYLEL